jgi:hypothetical protein
MTVSVPLRRNRSGIQGQLRRMNMRKRYAILFAISLFTVFGLGSSQASAASSRVVRVDLQAESLRITNRCPATVDFRGSIKMDGPGTVSYTFERSDGATAPIYTLHFSEGGTQEVSTTWRLGRSYSGYQKLKVLAPNRVDSGEARFELNCGGILIDPPIPPMSSVNVFCPIEQARTEMVSRLPEGWWQTPQLGNLVSLGVQNIGGEPTLVCRYSAYGAQVSVMRRFPEGKTDCRVSGSNRFTCR